MSRTIEGSLSFNFAMGEMTYLCSCNRRCTIRIEDLVPDEFVDYCGCDDFRLSHTAGQVAYYRKLAGLPQLGE